MKKNTKFIIIPIILIILIFAGFFWYLDNIDTALKFSEPENTNSVIKNNESKKISLNDFQIYGNVISLIDGDDLFIVNYNTLQSEWSGETYHIDLADGSVVKIDSPYLLKDQNKYFGIKTYKVDYEFNPDSQGQSIYSGYELNQNRLEEIANELNIEMSELQIEPYGGKPSFRVLVKFEYDPQTKEISLLPKESAKLPEYCNPTFCFNTPGEFYVGNIKYPTEDFEELFYSDEETREKELFNIKFSLENDVLSLEY